jgi:HEAT repeat protein
LLADPDPALRRTAAEQLGQIGHPAGVNPLLAALRDPDEDVRWWSAWALGRMGPPAEKALQRLLHDPDPRVRHWATEALNKIKGIPFDPAPR